MLSCLEEGECCRSSCYCEQARHGKDHRRISDAHASVCKGFDFTTCREKPCPERDYAVVPRCRWGKCVAEKIKREPPPPGIDLSGYDKSCSTDDDCTVVHSQPCAKCGCADEPIAASELERFHAEKAAVKCPPYDPWPDIDCGACMHYEAYCNEGTCESRSG